jgi:hypothetical protein
MKVIGFGEPERVRIRFAAAERRILLDVVRDLRAEATVAAAETYREAGQDDARPVDARHDRLRAVEELLVQMEGESPDRHGGVALVAETPLMMDVVRAGAREALRRLNDGHERYLDRPIAGERRKLGAGTVCEGGAGVGRSCGARWQPGRR